ncbi:carboxypeptidase [Aeropyrum camini SY1 = JCM 12091]|uniref:Metal-dependent carboxypeptidase n=1 Tax=Aeropyrum camini SY1 = JCM 12091 TaxID=1198449 RepID=U3TAM7_9CREN|nr:carboxypeptidase [Aeropyrum camini SY1 = JCM 12091]
MVYLGVISYVEFVWWVGVWEVFENSVVRELVEAYRPVWSVSHALSLMGWDSETYMPKGGVGERALARADLFVLRRRLLLREELLRLLERAESQEGLNEYEAGVVRVLKREVRIARSLPEEFVFEFAKLREEATHAWRTARERDDFGLFKPYLERIVEYARRMADYLGWEGHPYNALLDLHEEGLTVVDVDRMFDSIVPTLRRALERVLSTGSYPRSHPLESVEYERGVMEAVNREVLDLLGFPWDRGRLDVSPHPFTISMGIGDVRITTRYEGRDFRHTLFAVIHEYGHALYELQIDERLKASPLAEGASLGVHESQSRFWENVVARSRAFIPQVTPILRRRLSFLKDYSDEDVYLYFNIVRPGLIRVEADELTYNFHIYLRYTLEKGLIEGSIKVDDLPELWNSMMDDLLGVRPKSYRDGVLQDVHWSHGSIGYFPTYTLGTVLSAQIKAAIDRSLGGLYRLVEKGELGKVRMFLRENIHRYGSTYPPKELVERGLGEPLNPEYYNQYITEKFYRG